MLKLFSEKKINFERLECGSYYVTISVNTPLVSGADEPGHSVLVVPERQVSTTRRV